MNFFQAPQQDNKPETDRRFAFFQVKPSILLISIGVHLALYFMCLYPALTLTRNLQRTYGGEFYLRPLLADPWTMAVVTGITIFVVALWAVTGRKGLWFHGLLLLMNGGQILALLLFKNPHATSLP